jgi:hypothetical protein
LLPFVDSKGGREVLTLVVLLALAALWAVVLIPPLLRSRTTGTRSADSIGEFNYKLGVLSRTGAGSSAPSPFARPAVRAETLPAARRARTDSLAPSALSLASSPPAAKRRADVLRVLVVAVALTMALAYLTGSPLLWGLQLLSDLALGTFLGLWAWVRSLQHERDATVRFLPQSRTPEFALRRTASS